MPSPTTTLGAPIPTHSNNILTETKIEKNPDAKPHDRAGEPGKTDRGFEHMTEGSESDDVTWVDWEGPEDPANPKKYVAAYPEFISKTEWSFSWSYRKKWA